VPHIEATHWICGTPVSTDVPDDYDLEEGVALACPLCQDVWWHYPLARDASGQTGIDSTIAGRRLGPDHEAVRDRRPLLATSWLGPGLVLCAIAIALLRLSDLGPRSTAASSAAPRSAVTGAGVGQAPAYINVIAPPYRLERPADWIRYERNGAQVFAPTRGAPISMSVFVDRRPELSLNQMAGLAEQLLDTQLPGAKITGPLPMRLSGRSARRITARRGTFLREMVVVAGGPLRYVIQASSRAGASQQDLAALNRMVRSFQATP
jgi:hypothetical protein